ncbi:unnamed protein product [Rotaria sordida]|uniref:Uncharacterized protein n=1 Tax=Rotaria sordida TaxID=392033 RepID=A0A815CX53_9BILA|nr:unnamed protein product [Rotaria sordida]CAF1180268.1 unnamed protein product [Rotaria sordida]CAF1234290.1 unnamed protein product [Rotaria sordida]CAF1289327.1 unnamed protein product [Rotaria sordida]CAF1440420.1 unnamed protein product [Rotaria sordida]
MSAQDKNYRRKIYACALKNVSDYDAKVVLTYAAIEYDNGEVKNTRLDMDVEKGKIRYLSERLITKRTHNVREVIEQIDVTLSNGTKLELKAPFDGVENPTADWHFVIENTQIKSAGPTPEYGK